MVRRTVEEQIDHAVIDTLKPIVMKLLESYYDKVPEPTLQNTTRSLNTRNMIELRDWFFSHFDLKEREKPMRALFTWFIIHADFDRPYRLWFLALLKEALTKEWDFSEGKPYHWI